MITTAQLAAELGITQRSIQHRIMRLLARRVITDVERAGNSFVLTKAQANAVREYGQSKGK